MISKMTEYFKFEWMAELELFVYVQNKVNKNKRMLLKQIHFFEFLYKVEILPSMIKNKLFKKNPTHCTVFGLNWLSNDIY